MSLSIGIVDESLTASTVTWEPPETTYRYQWSRNSKKITGATAPTYLLVAKDRSTRLKVKVTGSAVGYYTSSRYSKSTAFSLPIALVQRHCSQSLEPY